MPGLGASPVGGRIFECDDTSRTCLQGRIFGVRGGFVGVVLAEDRQTICELCFRISLSS
jgi:hypothetical protein